MGGHLRICPVTPPPPNLVEIRDLQFAWPGTAAPTLVLPELVLEPGKSLLIEGPSGSGKTTLLNLLGGVLVPQHGTLRVLDRDLPKMSGAQRDALRAEHIGFLFQQFNLVPYLSVVENVLLPCRFSAVRRRRAESEAGSLAAAAERWLTELGLVAEQRKAVTALSVGQQQRVAAARALIGQPALVIADEPTSALDTDLRDAFVTQLFAACRAAETGVVVVSHDRSLGKHFDEVVDLRSLNRVGEEMTS